MIKLTSIVAAVALMSSSIVAASPEDIGQNIRNTWHGIDTQPPNNTHSAIYESAFGYWAGHRTNYRGAYSVYVGHMAGYTRHGYGNILLGSEAGVGGLGRSNIHIGYQAGGYSTGSVNIFLGSQTGKDWSQGSIEYESNVLYIGNKKIGDGDKELPGLPLISGNFLDQTLDINGTLDVDGLDGVDGDVTVAGVIKSSFNGDDTANNHNMLVLDVNNTGAGNSDVGFSLENKESDFKWAFRTYNPSEGFTATKIGTGATEFEVSNMGTDKSTTVVEMGGVAVFENGKLLNDKGEAFVDLIAALEVKIAALEAK